MCCAHTLTFKIFRTDNIVKLYVVTSIVGIKYVVFRVIWKKIFVGYQSQKIIFTPLFSQLPKTAKRLYKG